MVCLLLYNVAVDKHVFISVFISARGKKCSWDASFFCSTPLSSTVSLLMLLLAKAGLIMGHFKPGIHQHELFPWGYNNSLKCSPERLIAPIGLTIFTHGWHSSSCKVSHWKWVPNDRCPAAEVCVQKWLPLNRLGLTQSKDYAILAKAKVPSNKCFFHLHSQSTY